ncbi:MAG TPA: asparagine--tRNA ligase, partial [Firmicutes bacterium]|nr:asparagine--tRNA ligase [Bacillota bacterium]
MLYYFSFDMEEVMKYPGSYATVREIYESISSGNNEFEEKLVVIDGWVRTNRNMGNIGFISFNDGTCFKCAQLVYSNETENYEQALKSKLGQAITITGIVHLTPNQKQPFEIELKEYTLVGDVDDSYPLQKKKTSFEYLRTIPHIRPRANTFMALYRVRSVLSFAIHDFFQGEGFIYIQTPVLTSNDCEGAGQAFKVVTNDKNPETDYFGKPVSLTVSGQLHAEPFALTFRDVYTFGPTFRAE